MGMIITRRPGESVAIGDARVTVVRLRNGRVKLSVEAPATIPITPGDSVCHAKRASAGVPVPGSSQGSAR
jgi:hypothetical protein